MLLETLKGVALRAQPPSPITYASPKAPALLEEDQRIIPHRLPVRAEAVEILPASRFMER
jgi:zinc protease